MPTFGKYETAQRLFLSGVGGVYALKGDDRKVIKVLHPPAGIWSEEQIREEIEGFRARAKAQKAVAGASKNWAPIHEAAALSSEEGEGSGAAAIESGAEAGEARAAAAGAYAVMDRYERSAQSLIDGKVNLNNDDLRVLFSGIVQGLLDLRKTAARAHGALKASNILLANSADLATATVHLTDPAAPLPDGTFPATSAAKDLSDLGRLLYQLVNLRPYDDGTIGRNKDWDELGPNGEDWRKLCHALLDAHAPAEERDLEKILARIGTWTAKPKKSKKPLIIAAAALLVVVGSIAAYFVFRAPPVKFDQSRWDKLALAYYLWFDDFTTEMYKMPVRDKFRQAPYPTEVAKLFDDAAKDLDNYSPKQIAAAQGMDWETLIKTPTDSIHSGSAPKYTQQSLELVENVEAALSPAKWPVVTKLDETAKRYEAMGWQKPAGGIRSVILAAQPPPTPVTGDIAERLKKVEEEKAARKETILQSVERTITAAKSVEVIDSKWAGIEKQLTDPSGGKVALLAKLGEWARALPQSKATAEDPGTLNDVTALAASFEKIETVLKGLNAALATAGRELDYGELTKDPAATAVPSIEAYQALAAKVPQYFKLREADDPRVKVLAAWKAQREQVQSDMTNFLAKAADAKVEGVQGRLDDLTARRATLERALADAAAIAGIEKNRETLAKMANDATTLANAITEDAATWSAPFKTDPDKYVKEKRDYLATCTLSKGTPPVYEQWKATWGRFLTKVEATKENLRKDYRYKLSVDDKFKAIEAVYRDIDAAIPVQVAGLSEIGGTDWRHAIAVRVATADREAALVDLMKNLPAGEDVPNAADPAFVSFRTQRLATYEKLRTDTLALLTDYATVVARLDQLDLQANEPAAGAANWRDLYNRWTGARLQSPPLDDGIVTAALKPINDRVGALLAVEGVSDYRALVVAAQSPVPEIALTAWRKMGTAPNSESVPALDDEDQAEAAVKARITALAAGTLDGAHVQRLNAEIAAQRPVRWHRWADALKGAAAIQTALDKAEAFGVTLNPQTDAAMIYNRTYYALGKVMANKPTEAELKPIAQKFMDDVAKMPALVTGDAGVKDLLKRMDEALHPKAGAASSKGEGPQLAGWTIEKKDGDQTRIFRSKDGDTLEFQKVMVNEANAEKVMTSMTIYLCTTEMSVGVFSKALNAGGKIDDVDNDKHPGAAHWFKPAGQDPLLARSWQFGGRQMGPKAKWLVAEDIAPNMIGQSVYPALAPVEPNDSTPMQLVTPWSAMYGARLLGCRLPTSDEWTAAYEKFEQPKTGAVENGAALPKDVWNLRGEGGGRATWRTQQDYKLNVMQTKPLPYPDRGIFLPSRLLFADIQAGSAKPWLADALAKVAPGRITSSPTPYQGNTLWFRSVDDKENPAAAGLVMHDLVGNVAEYVFDGDAATAVVAGNAPSTAAIDDAIKAGGNKLFVIGGSSLSPPDVPFNEKQPAGPTAAGVTAGYCDVGFRLAYTAPIDSIVDVLVNSFKEPKYLPGPRAGM
jgi:hypothetical protein